jgi:protein SCO1/2
MLKKIRTLLWALIAIIAIYTGFHYASNDNNTNKISFEAQDNDTRNSSTFMPVAGLKPSKDFTLTDHNGNVFTQESEAWKAPYKLIYFGFAYCPMICPTELQKMTKALNNLPAEKANKIQPILISIDPERDTAESLKTYISSFHPKFIGLTGTPEQIKHIADDWKVFYKKVEDDSLNGYTMDHSSYIYLQDQSNQILGIFRMKDSSSEITKYLEKVID